MTIQFEDGWRAIVLGSDVGLGGLNTRVTAFMTDGFITADMAANAALETYAEDCGNLIYSAYLSAEEGRSVNLE